MILLRTLGALALCPWTLACVPRSRPAVETPPVTGALSGLPPRTDPPLSLEDDDDLRRARHAYDALYLDAPSRPGSRRSLLDEYRRRLESALASERREQAYQTFVTALELWDPQELADETRTPPDLDLIAADAEQLREQFAGFGADLQTVTALAVLISAEPGRAAELQKTWLEVAQYADELAIAEAGPGAERARPIHLLEEVTRHFASPWAARTLARLYAEREDALSMTIAKSPGTTPNSGIMGAHGHGATRPVWNLIRAHARMDRLADAIPAVEKIAGHSFDDRELRSRLAAALAPSATGQAWEALSKYYLGEDPRNPRDPSIDPTTARRICLEGLRRLPGSLEPLRCLGVVAYLDENIPAAVKWFEKVHDLAREDAEIASVLARLYELTLNDLVFGERLQAARKILERLERFHASLARSGKPIEPGLESAYLAMGRGLYNLGEIAEGYGFLERALKMKVSPEALEQLAMIDSKRGAYATAAERFAQAAAMPRETPLIQKIERARLRRLAAEAYGAAGDAARARRVATEALAEWDSVLDAAVSTRQRADMFVERGRLLWSLSRRDDALESFDMAVDLVSEAQPTSSVFSDVIAFLIPRGMYDAARDVYLRLLADASATEYFKIYTSLWVSYLANIMGQEPDPLATDFLRSRRGGRWYHDLSRFATGNETWEGLWAKADTRGKRAEACFYRGLALYAARDREGGDRLMRDVLSTEMFGFFEFDMARFFLQNGPPLGGVPRGKP